ncbi:putative SUR7 family protein FMP45 [Calycina marina]|uniref:SUR7 family protein FMP45 n=1 Tax=Calycina marina TaxID=1763456 RepID=A0A9P7Z383_9HELO|nr:putative SUR7 family protein FMP45 [Calycina marina]
MAAGIRGATGLISLVLIAGSLVLLLFVVLSGVKHTTPLKQTYFLQADTSSITGARAISQWTYFYVCGEGNTDCGKPVPDLPIGYAWVSSNDGVPASLVGSHGKGTTSRYYYYMWRFGWVFYLLALTFDAFAFLTAMASPFSRLAAGFAGLMVAIALFWMSLAAALMTVTFVKLRNVFQANDMSASLGKYAFGFTWGAWAAMFLATLMLFFGCCMGGRNKDHVRDAKTTNGNTGFYRRQRRASATRHSFVDGESQRRVKDEYA